MKLFLISLVFYILPLLITPSLCFGHACDDPWRPDPSNVGAPSGGGAGGPVAPPPPPPAPGEPPPSGPTGPDSPTNLGPGTAGPGGGLVNQLPTDALGSGGNATDSPDSIVLIPETSQLKIVGKSGEFRTYIVNRSPRDLFSVKMEAISPAFETEVTPDSIRRLVSGEKDYFTVKLKVKGKLHSGKFPMDFKVSSRGNLIYEGSMGGDAPAKQTVKENLGIRLKADDITIVGKGSFIVFIKNNIYNEVNQVRVEVNSKYFDVEANPKHIPRLSPGQEAKFEVNIIPKKGVKPGAYDIRLHALTSSRNVASNLIITIKVGKNTAQK
ncbi:hypothetical protein JW933_01650 [candidate division FCPU426 bacterium]|nr:hypothetical protein [candidate division FCPU426 bacterium]